MTKTTREHLLTSAAVAAALRVGVSSVKRWTDEGKLPSVRTPGGHRRYELPALHKFASAYGYSAEALAEVEPPPLTEDVAAIRDSLLAALERGDAESVSSMVGRGDQGGGIAMFLDTIVGETLRRIGELWESGEWGIEEEHQASYIIAEAIDRLHSVQPADAAPVALLASPPAEQHELPLRMVRVIVERAGFHARFLGANTPWKSAEIAAQRIKPRLIAMSARSSEPFDSERFVTLCEAWRSAGIEVVIGGAWARGGSQHRGGALRFRSLQGFEKWLRRSQK